MDHEGKVKVILDFYKELYTTDSSNGHLIQTMPGTATGRDNNIKLNEEQQELLTGTIDLDSIIEASKRSYNQSSRATTFR